MSTTPPYWQPPQPTFRRLQIYAFDPSLGTHLDLAALNRTTLRVPWEREADLQPGPIGDYLEVIDVDPASQCVYPPVDLNERGLLAQDGVEPSEGLPQFHQQMAFAVAMRTIWNFELALGRCALWHDHDDPVPEDDTKRFVQRLRIYPHALRQANAYYSPDKKSLLFGYFPAGDDATGDHMPGSMVFTCLSHDVVAHETTHALLHGLKPYSIQDSNPDALAFHEAFADLVALLQHFSLPEVLRNQLARTRGDLGDESLMGQLAQQFGRAIGERGALRDALGKVDKATGQWHPDQPSTADLRDATEPHARGAVLVAAVFEAFVAIYRRRAAPIVRLATGGGGVLPPGEIRGELVEALAKEAAKAAQHVLTMCIRALDYMPPVDMTFGDYLRALVTADWDLVPDDPLGYRVAMVEAFRRRGIYPRDVVAVSPDSLRWDGPTTGAQASELAGFIGADKELLAEWILAGNRGRVWQVAREARERLHEALAAQPTLLDRWTGLVRTSDVPLLMHAKYNAKQNRFKVASIRPVRRIGRNSEFLADLVIELTQRRWINFDGTTAAITSDGYWYLGGCTLIVDVATGAVRYAIRKDLTSPGRLQRETEYRRSGAPQSMEAAVTAAARSGSNEPFACLHMHN